MKQWTKKFLKGECLRDSKKDGLEYNANKCKETFGIPKKVYKELSKKYTKSNLYESINAPLENEDIRDEMNFLAGFCAGCAESNKKIK